MLPEAGILLNFWQLSYNSGQRNLNLQSPEANACIQWPFYWN